MRHMRLLMALAAAPLVVLACSEATTPANEAVDVTVGATSFDPPVLNVQPADSTAGGEDGALPFTVSWEIGEGTHNIVFQDGTTSGALSEGSTFEREFTNTQPGVYRYRCTLHSTDFTSGQVGEVIVY